MKIAEKEGKTDLARVPLSKLKLSQSDIPLQIGARLPGVLPQRKTPQIISNNYNIYYNNY